MSARLLKFSNRFTSYNSYAIELKLGRMILDMDLLNCYEQDFLDAGGGAQRFKVFRGHHLYIFFCLAVAGISVSSI